MSLVFISLLKNLPANVHEWLVQQYVDEIKWRNALMTRVLN
jgi:tetrahydromethanopterin S-methyltransferase subunit F